MIKSPLTKIQQLVSGRLAHLWHTKAKYQKDDVCSQQLSILELIVSLYWYYRCSPHRWGLNPPGYGFLFGVLLARPDHQDYLSSSSMLSKMFSRQCPWSNFEDCTSCWSWLEESSVYLEGWLCLGQPRNFFAEIANRIDYLGLVFAYQIDFGLPGSNLDLLSAY